MKEEVSQQIKDIKQSFRLAMDGAVAASMRAKGVHYQLNWGVTLPRLKEMAQSSGKNYELAIGLWKENVRECKILATMIMPETEILPEVVDIWMEQTSDVEIAEQAAFNLYQHLPYAAEKAYQWMASDKELYQLCGFLVITRLFAGGHEPNERGISEFLDQAITAVQSDCFSVRKAALNSLRRFSELGLVFERMTKSALKSVHLDFF